MMWLTIPALFLNHKRNKHAINVLSLELYSNKRFPVGIIL